LILLFIIEDEVEEEEDDFGDCNETFE